ncbi:hypothetical protein A3F00_01215 [Candidatus Daviesbacteria bacterium RIFCSPHIGHO2_12_FULL_37_11]|uniref:Uncharacterized protein n=1 Tax=Candidatus Daviesbacteria bacterium RIFCSPHIGHO2_12_FULL_37_11 TaxID=1797777 RepID=A0A1F5KA88_9BACT|nr:MAG: hypothetical protein A3F00_01215 [Candidatus Daviesbacteria bacterium RIFCSPHIGHO2_12_FULL_37_11]
MSQKGFANIIIIGIVVIIVAGVASQQTSPEKTKNYIPIQKTQNSIGFSILYPPTPSSFGCNPYTETYETQQGKAV